MATPVVAVNLWNGSLTSKGRAKSANAGHGLPRQGSAQHACAPLSDGGVLWIDRGASKECVEKALGLPYHPPWGQDPTFL